MRKLLTFFFVQVGAKKNQKTPKRGFRSLRRATRALPVDFWMLNFAEIQHRVASLTLESITTFTRHNAFLKKAGENFHPVRRLLNLFCRQFTHEIVDLIAHLCDLVPEFLGRHARDAVADRRELQ